MQLLCAYFPSTFRQSSERVFWALKLVDEKRFRLSSSVLDDMIVIRFLFK